MGELNAPKTEPQRSRHRFQVLGPENGEAFIELVTAMQHLRMELDRLYYPFRKLGAIWSLQSRNRYPNASWKTLPTVLYKHAFDIALVIRNPCPPEKWGRTGSLKDRKPVTRNGRWLRISDGTIATIDLGKTEHWVGRFDAEGNQISPNERWRASEVANAPWDFAQKMFNSCDVLVMEDFRRQLNNPTTLRTPESAWLARIGCDRLYRCLLSEAQETRRRLVLSDAAWTSWTCPYCQNIHKGHDRTDPPRVWRCPMCGETVQRDAGSCLELRRRYLSRIHITYDIAVHGPSGFALRR